MIDFDDIQVIYRCLSFQKVGFFEVIQNIFDRNEVIYVLKTF